VDGQKRALGDKKYLISPQDLAAYDLVPQLLGLVRSLKIEGRLKTPEYVAATTRAYRKAVDGAALTRTETLGLQQVFSRGFSHGFLDGINHQVLVRGLSPKKRGIYLGEVAAVRGSRVTVRLEAHLKPGDGVVFDFGRPDEDEPGGRVLHLWKRGVRVESADSEAVEFEVRDCPLPKPGWKVWKTDDPAINRALRATFEKTGCRVPIDAVVDGALRVTFSDGVRTVSGEIAAQPAKSQPLAEPYLREHLGRLGDTPFALRDLRVDIGPVWAPVREINGLRRILATQLEQLRRANPRRRIAPGALDRLRRPPSRTETEPRLAVLCRSMDQVRAALEEGVNHLECDFEDIRKYREAAALAPVFVAPPRILRPGEQGILKFIQGCGAAGVLARSTAHLGFFDRCIADFSFNVANELTADWILPRVERFVPSYDLNWEQLGALLARTDPGRAEVVVHQQMPMFHNEHCIFAAILSNGTDATNCGRPCDRHRLELEDRVGKRHPVKADVGCRNTIYNAVPQSASQYIRPLLDLGVRWFRIELLLHSAEETRRLIRGYRDVIEGRTDGQALWRELHASNFMGVTRGPLGREE
jgi:putative protease